MKRDFFPVLVRQAVWQQNHKEVKRKVRDQTIREYILIHDNLDGFDMEKYYTKDYPQKMS